MKNKNSHRATEAQSEAQIHVLDIGMRYFVFSSPAKAAQAFALLAEAVHVRREYAMRPGGDYFYEPAELIGGLKLSGEPTSALRESAKSADKKKDSHEPITKI